MFLFKTKYILLLAIIFGLAASYSVIRYFRQQEERFKKPAAVVTQVVVASTDLPSGAKLSEKNLKVSPWPEGAVPKGAFEEIKDLTDRVVRSDLVEGEPVLASRLVPVGSDGGLLTLIPEGMRAMTIGVNVVSGVNGFILPNNTVDVLTTMGSMGTNRQASTKMVLQNVKVLAIDQNYDRASNAPVSVQSVTLLVSPEEGG